jgi:ABC-type methionine transport system ATPase subunit
MQHKGVEVATRLVTFTFTQEITSEPIIYNISQQFSLMTNIRQAKLTEHGGYIVLELTGKDEDIEDGITWAISKGVRVDLVGEET